MARKAKRSWWPIVCVAALAICVALLLAPQMIWKAVAGPADQGPVDFSSLKRPDSPNHYLVCRPADCPGAEPDSAPPVFARPASALAGIFAGAVLPEPHLSLVESKNKGHALRYVQTSNWLKFPDTISVRIIAIDDKSSTLAIYSRSQIGYSDLGKNQERVERWLDRLSDLPRAGQ